MAATISTSATVSNVTGYAVFAAAEIGSNGSTSGQPEYRVGTSYTSFVSDRRVWDADLSDGLDSDEVFVSLVANPGGGSDGVAWTVSGGDTVPLPLSGASYGAITQVKIVAGVRTAGAGALISDISVRFYKDGSLTQTVVCDPLAADTQDFASEVQEAIATITPNANDNTKVVIECKVRLVLQSDTVNNPDDIYCRFYLFSA